MYKTLHKYRRANENIFLEIEARPYLQVGAGSLLKQILLNVCGF